MSDLAEQLVRIGAELRRRARRFAVVGGLAVSARSEPRLTRDVDLAVAVVSDEDAEALVLDLQHDGYRVVAAVEQTETGRLATIRLSRVEGAHGPVVDLLFASSGIEHEVAMAAEQIEVLPGVLLPVARTGHLIAMKLLARDDRRRPADADDLAALREVATPEDWDLARAAVDLIEARRSNRERDLRVLLTELRERGAY